MAKSNDIVTLERLLKPRLPEAEVDVPGVGTVRVRGLSRIETLIVQRAVEKGAEAMERILLSIAMVDPPMTESQVGVWQKSSVTNEMEAVTAKVSELSGLGDTSAKDAYKEFESDPDSEFRVLPGGEAEDDGGSDAGGDA